MQLIIRHNRQVEAKVIVYIALYILNYPDPILLSLVTPSYMVVSIRELANTLILSPSNLQSIQLIPSTPQQMNIEIDKTRGRSNMSSPNFSREPSVYFDALSMD